MQKFNFGKTFVLGFGFFGVSVIWSVYKRVRTRFPAGPFPDGTCVHRLLYDPG
jgi:hypothetical protein